MSLETAFWTAHESTAQFSEPGTCEARATTFERTIRRRNLFEFTAAAVVIVGMTAALVPAISIGFYEMIAAWALLLAGTAFVCFKLYRDGSNLSRTPEQTCRDHHRAQLVRQRDLLRGVPKWYLAPLVPGMLAVYLAVTARVAARHDWSTALGGVWELLVGTAAFFLFTGWLNLRAAKALDRRISELDREFD